MYTFINSSQKITIRLSAVILLCYFLTACTSLIFRPQSHYDALSKEIDTVKQDIYFKSQDGTKLHGWYLPSTQDSTKPKKTILYLHGTTKNISRHLGFVSWLPEKGYEVYIFDYRGYGKSEGEAHMEGVLSDIDAAIHFVVSKKANNQKIVVMGHSLGASMGIYALNQYEKKNQIESFIVLSAFSDYQQVTRDFLDNYWFSWLFQWPLSLTINNDYRPLDYVATLGPVETYFLHGANDEIIRPYHSEVLYKAAQQPKSISVLKTNHNDIFFYKENRQLVLDFLEK